MSKRALLIGINYFSTPAQLNGCITDVMQLAGVLRDVYKFNKNEIVVLRDDDNKNMPTKVRIIQELKALMNGGHDTVFLAYSGHGTNIADSGGDEQDGRDECICPCDYSTAGFITDDELNSIIKNNNKSSSGVMIFDCCHSGTILDMPYTNTGINLNTGANKAIICISGCQDNQTSAEIFNMEARIPQGALTMAFIDSIRNNNYFPSVKVLWDGIIKKIGELGVTQIPNLQSNVELSTNTVFPIPVPLQQLMQQQQQQAQQQAQITSLTTQLNTLMAENRGLKDSSARLTLENKTLVDTGRRLTTENNTLNGTITRLTGENRSLRDAIQRLNASTSQITQQLAVSNTDANKLKAQNADLSAKLADANAKLVAAANQIKK